MIPRGDHRADCVIEPDVGHDDERSIEQHGQASRRYVTSPFIPT